MIFILKFSSIVLIILAAIIDGIQSASTVLSSDENNHKIIELTVIITVNSLHSQNIYFIMISVKTFCYSGWNTTW